MSQLPSADEIQHLFIGQSLARTVIAPFDRVKYLLQCQGELVRLGRTDREFVSAYECYRRLSTIEGRKSFFRGNAVHVSSVLPTAFAQAFCGLPIQRAVFDTFQPSSPMMYTVASFTAGLAGAFASSIVSYPFDMVRFRLTCDMKAFDTAPYLYTGASQFVMHSHIVENPQLMYRGVGLYLAGSMCYRASYLWLFEYLTKIVPGAEFDDERVPLSTVITQAVAGYSVVSAATLLMYPLDTIRRRMMLSVNHYDLEYRSINHCVHTILRDEGPKAFFRGASFTIFRGALATLIAMSIGINI